MGVCVSSLVVHVIYFSSHVWYCFLCFYASEHSTDGAGGIMFIIIRSFYSAICWTSQIHNNNNNNNNKSHTGLSVHLCIRRPCWFSGSSPFDLERPLYIVNYRKLLYDALLVVLWYTVWECWNVKFAKKIICKYTAFLRSVQCRLFGCCRCCRCSWIRSAMCGERIQCYSPLQHRLSVLWCHLLNVVLCLFWTVVLQIHFVPHNVQHSYFCKVCNQKKLQSHTAGSN